MGSEPCILEAKPTSYTLHLVRFNFRFLFNLLSAGIRWPRYSKVGCIYLKRVLLLSCKKALKHRAHEFGMGQKYRKEFPFRTWEILVYSRMALFTSRDFLLPFLLHTMKCGLILLIYCMVFMVPGCMGRCRGQSVAEGNLVRTHSGAAEVKWIGLGREFVLPLFFKQTRKGHFCEGLEAFHSRICQPSECSVCFPSAGACVQSGNSRLKWDLCSHLCGSCTMMPLDERIHKNS